jgi:prepilin-type N-terminal cleavage/methylation domain-containing protein
LEVKIMFDFKKGFTLAEVLITLGIIGVVAALTMPSLIVNYQKQQTVIQLKKAYSDLNQAVKLASLDYEEFEYKGDTVEGRQAFLEEYFLPYLKTVQVCAPIAQCGIDSANYKFLNGAALSSTTGINASSVGAVLADGAVFIVGMRSTTGDRYTLYIDINGKKGPNVMSKDLFRLSNSNIALSSGIAFEGKGRAREDIILPTGHRSNCNTAQNGSFCGWLMMLDGWEIRDDYPW